MASTNGSTLTGRAVVAYARTFKWTTPVLGVSGWADEPAVSFLDDIMKKIMAKANPWPWNEVVPAPFFTQPYQQDYPTSISQNDLGWLQSAVMLDVNNVTPDSENLPPLQVVQRLLPMWNPGVPTKLAWLPNSSAQLASWPGAGTFFQNPLVSQGGGPGSNPPTAIRDPNGNIQVVTTYGTTGSGPTWPDAGADAGATTTDGSVVWTVQDPNGVTFRLDFIASFGSNVWQIMPTFQAKAQPVTRLGQNFAPIPDDLSYLIKSGFLAYCYQQVDHAKFQIAYAEWQAAIKEALGASDREDQEFGFYPADAIQSGSGTAGYDYGGWPGNSTQGNS